MFRIPAIRAQLIFAVAITAVTAVSCELGLRLFWESGRSVSFIWPAAGVCMGIFSRWGVRALPWVILGHAAIWLRVPMTWFIGILPVVYALEAGFASYLGFRLPLMEKPDRSAMDRTAWRLLLVPWLASVPCAALSGWLATINGHFSLDDLPMTIARISMAHAHGMIAVGPLAVHLLRSDFSLSPGEKNFTGIAAIAGALCLMVLAFMNFFSDVLGLNASAYLPFPLVIMVGVTCRPRLTAIFMAIWCVSTTLFTSQGLGPFGEPSGWGHSLELGIYNLIICCTAYLVSVGSTRFLHLLRRNDLSLEAAGVEVWEWDRFQGLHPVTTEAGTRQAEKTTGNLQPLQALAALANISGDHPGPIPERWKHRMESKGNSRDLVMSFGRILARDRDGLPRRAIGMLQDLSAIRTAEEALVALGHQRAQLRSLQTRLNPHFLFNALNATRALIHLDPRKASEAVTTLARLLRANLRNTDRPLIPLADEMQLVTDLLTVSGLRFGDRLRIHISVETAAEDALVPPMMIFNLVENAILHGIEKSPGPGTIALEAKVLGEDLFLSVSNPGQLQAPLSSGIGTRDAKQRLELIFGALGRFRLFQRDGSTVLAEIVIPFRDYESAHC